MVTMAPGFKTVALDARRSIREKTRRIALIQGSGMLVRPSEDAELRTRVYTCAHVWAGRDPKMLKDAGFPDWIGTRTYGFVPDVIDAAWSWWPKRPEDLLDPAKIALMYRRWDEKYAAMMESTASIGKSRFMTADLEAGIPVFSFLCRMRPGLMVEFDRLCGAMALSNGVPFKNGRVDPDAYLDQLIYQFVAGLVARGCSFLDDLPVQGLYSSQLPFLTTYRDGPAAHKMFRQLKGISTQDYMWSPGLMTPREFEISLRANHQLAEACVPPGKVLKAVTTWTQCFTPWDAMTREYALIQYGLIAERIAAGKPWILEHWCAFENPNDVEVHARWMRDVGIAAMEDAGLAP